MMETGVLREVAIQVSGYFRDFLESDFKKKSAPRRRIVLQSDAGFRCGMRTRPYEKFDQALWGLLSQPSGSDEPLAVSPRQFTRSLSSTLRKVIDGHINEIAETVVERCRQSIEAEIVKTSDKAAKDPEAWIEELQTFVASDIDERIVRPLVQKLDEPMRRSSYDFVDSLYSAENDMVRMVCEPLVGALPDALARYAAAPAPEILTEVLQGFLQLDRVKESLSTFFDGFVTADAYLELRDIETYATINEGFQLYLYIGSMKFRSAQYPLFFVPVDVKKLDSGRGFEISLVSQLFANRSAVDFVLQELAAAKNREWVNPIHERILYLTPEQSVIEVARRLFNDVAAAMGLACQSELSSRGEDVNAADVSLSPALHLCAFERGEESLVNDYEEIITLARQGGSEIVDLFERMVGGILTENPVSIAKNVEEEWDGLPMVDRMVYDSPIPLNEEQRKVLLAVRNPEGPIVVVEGPPGTGKSHTITAIAADCAFNQRSCLILSDKAEALQVVHDKLSEAMSRVRHVGDFPNPLLRLGRQDANFKRLVANQTVSQVAAYAKASAKNMPDLIAERDGTATSLKKSIEQTIKTLGSVQMSSVARMHELEATLRKSLPQVVEIIGEMEPDEGLARRIEALMESKFKADKVTDGSAIKDYLQYVETRNRENGVEGLASLKEHARCDIVVADALSNIGDDRLNKTAIFSSLSGEQAKQIMAAVLQYKQLKAPIIGYLFKGGKVRALEASINVLPVKQPILLKEHADELVGVCKTALELDETINNAAPKYRLARLWPSLSKAHERAHAPIRKDQANLILMALEVLQEVPGLFEALQSQPAWIWSLTLDYLVESLSVRAAFKAAPTFDYVGTKGRIERLNTSLMNAHVDSRLVDFIDNHRSDAKTMAQLIAQRQKFPEEKFGDVKASFPIILSGIREFGEFMPLVPGLFDVIVIDEASQVSVAQALPALLRAKKVVCLGDSRQFSNVKSANASIAVNEKYRANLVQFFERNVTRNAETLQRLSMFDIKRSVLEFCGLAASYSVMLRKHFRSYPELIGYSSKTFYGGQLQALKVRARPIDEVIKFEKVDTAGKKVTRAINEAEADAITARLEELLEQESPPSVGVITPFREQHTLLQKRLFAHPRASEFESRLRLKIMTFDSCQGEERSIIFYSMVATAGLDALNYIFPVALENAQESVEEKLKVQRLNVGFSRAQDCIWIMHSQEIGLFKGAIGQALHHYQGVLNRRPADVSQTDQNSPMEAKVLQWLEQTQFVQAQPEDVEIIPQFPIGDYLRQLDPTYQHPSWRVDFLLTCRTPKGALHIVVEYDGFEFHFESVGKDIHVGNHERYLKESDVERQLTLESYGYRFLRINRFNLGSDPVAVLDQRLAKLVELATGEQSSRFVERLRDQAAGLTNKEMKACSRCETIHPLSKFWDPELKGGQGGHGRVCMDCKTKDKGKGWR